MLNNTEHHCFVFLSERLILLVFHQRDMWSLTFPSFVGWQSHPFYLGFLKKAGSSHLALTFVTIDQLQLNITRDWDTNNIYVLQLNDYKRCPNQLRKSPYGESSMGARQQKACAGKVSHLKSHCSPCCLFSTFDTTTTQRSCRDLFSHLMSSPVPFQLRSHYTSVAGTATNTRKNCYKNMHAFLTSLSFSFALSFILLSSAAFLKNGNEHWFIRPTILT